MAAPSKASTKSAKAAKEEEIDDDLDAELEDDAGMDDADLDLSPGDEEPEEEKSRKEDSDKEDDIDLDTPMTSPSVEDGGEDKFADLRPEHLGLRNFRNHPDFENFYRFVNEYGLRREAYMTIDRVLTLVGTKKKKSPKGGKKKKH